MPGELEIIKVVINGGSFAVIVVFVLHYIFKAEPKNRETIEKIESGYRQTIQDISKEHRTAIEKLTEDHKATVKILQESHERLVTSMLKECRDERKEMMTAIAEEGKLNRMNRHEIADTYQKSIVELHDLVATVRNKQQRAS